MASYKVLACFVAFCFVVTLQVEGYLTTKKPIVCLDPEWNNTNPNDPNVVTQSFTNFWSRINVSASDNVKSFGVTLQKLYDTTDSPSLRYKIAIVTFFIYATVSNPNQPNRFCAFSRLLNETIQYTQTKENCDGTIAALRSAIGLVNSVCSIAVYNSLSALNCEIPSPPPLSGQCSRNGVAFDINAALDIWGQTYPCILREGLITLHRSKLASDVAVALLWFTQEVEPLTQVNFRQSQQRSTEMNQLQFSTPSKSCCQIRVQRASEICNGFQQQASESVEEVIHSYFYDN